jgi:fumarate reductase flavoprotein subunit
MHCPMATSSQSLTAEQRQREDDLVRRHLPLVSYAVADMANKVPRHVSRADLESAVSDLQALLERSRHIGLRCRSRAANPELVTAYRVQKMLKVALCIAYGALMRTESRGAHFRQDFPRRNDAEWLKRTLATWKSEADTLPSLAYEALDVGRMELPPGWRGYGAKDYIEHPDTPKRAAEVEARRRSMRGASRFAVQESLMPYEELLPKCYRGRNERIDEPLERVK